MIDIDFTECELGLKAPGSRTGGGGLALGEEEQERGSEGERERWRERERESVCVWMEDFPAAVRNSRAPC